MKKITVLLIAAFLLGGMLVSCSKKSKTSNEEMKKKIEAKSENGKNIRKLVKPIMKKQIDVRKLRRIMKKKKEGELKSDKKEVKTVPATEKPAEKQLKPEVKTKEKAPEKKVEKKEDKAKKAETKTPEKK